MAQDLRCLAHWEIDWHDVFRSVVALSVLMNERNEGDFSVGLSRLISCNLLLI